MFQYSITNRGLRNLADAFREGRKISHEYTEHLPKKSLKEIEDEADERKSRADQE